MPEISYKDTTSHLDACRTEGFAPVYLVFGEEFLVDRVSKILVNELLPDAASRDIYLETVGPSDTSAIFDAVERLNTFSFMSERKVVRLKGEGFFTSNFQPAKQIDKIKDARDQGNEKKAVNLFLALLGRQQTGIEDILSGDIARGLQMTGQSSGELEWLRDLARICHEQGRVPHAAEDTTGALKKAIEKGFPRNHHLVVITDSADRRTALYKSIKAQGTIIDCSVPKGARKADRDEQKRVLSRMMKQALSRHKKRAENGVFDRVFDLTGFDPRAFSGNVDKLIHYVGNEERITLEDVSEVLDRSREDPIYALTGAVSERNAGQALYYLSTLLDGGYHYMQLLAAIANQMRKLLTVKTFVDNCGGAWQPGMRFDQFKKQTLPAVSAYDKQLQEKTAERSERFLEPGKKGGKSSSDLGIVKNPNNPYPIYQSFLQSDRFTGPTLVKVMIKLHEADIRLKTTGQRPKAVLEAVIFDICL